MMLGSARQSQCIERQNASHSGTGKLCCWPLLEPLAQKLSLEWDSFILEDCLQNPCLTHNDVQEPMILQNTLSKWNEKELNEKTARTYLNLLAQASVAHVDNDEKIVLLYAQVHRCSLRFSEQTIIYTFVDDREDILESLKLFYSNHTDLIPTNVTLRLVLYNHHNLLTTTPTTLHKIQGTGNANNSYPAVVNALRTAQYRQPNSWEKALLTEAQRTPPTTKVAGTCLLSKAAASAFTMSGAIAAAGLTFLIAGLAVNPVGAVVIAASVGVIVMGIVGFALYSLHQSHKHKTPTRSTTASPNFLSRQPSYEAQATTEAPSVLPGLSH